MSDVNFLHRGATIATEECVDGLLTKNCLLWVLCVEKIEKGSVISTQYWRNTIITVRECEKFIGKVLVVECNSRLSRNNTCKVWRLAWRRQLA